jgi:hypothetical protein
VQQAEEPAVAHLVGDGVDGGGVVEVTAGGHVGQEQVVADHGHEEGHVGRREAHAGGHLLDHHLAGDGVVGPARAGEALADVVQPGADEEQVGAVDLGGVLGGGGRRLAQVTVDGEAVVGVALGPAADRGPLREEADQQAGLVEGLQDGDGGPAGAEQGHQVGPGLGVPCAVEASRRLGGEAVEAVAAQRRANAGRGRRRPQHEPGVVRGVGAGGQLHLAFP